MRNTSYHSKSSKQKKIKTSTQSTVLIVDANQTKSLSISSWKLQAIKPALLILSIFAIAFASLSAVLGMKYLNHFQETVKLQKQVDDLKNATSSEIEAKLTALKKSESAIKALQAYLEERDVTVPEVSFESHATGVNDAAGGPEIKLSRPIPYIGDFSEQVGSLLEKAKTVPFGRPHPGSLSSGFGPRFNPFTGRGGEFHGGLDFRGKTGEPITVTANGVVDFAGVQRGYGNVVIVKHAHNYKTYYAHMSALSVKKGQKVKVGDEVGKLGSTGRSTGPHLHYEVRIKNERKNPKPYINFNKS